MRGPDEAKIAAADLAAGGYPICVSTRGGLPASSGVSRPWQSRPEPSTSCCLVPTTKCKTRGRSSTRCSSGFGPTREAREPRWGEDVVRCSGWPRIHACRVTRYAVTPFGLTSDASDPLICSLPGGARDLGVDHPRPSADRLPGVDVAMELADEPTRRDDLSSPEDPAGPIRFKAWTSSVCRCQDTGPPGPGATPVMSGCRSSCLCSHQDPR